VSEFTKRERVRLFGISVHKIEVIYEGVDARFKPAQNGESIKKKCGIDGKFMLHVGAVEPRRNIGVLIRAFYRLKKQGIRHKLVLGACGTRRMEI